MKSFKQFLRLLFEATEEQKYNQYKQIPYDVYKKILLGDIVYNEDREIYQKLNLNKPEDFVWNQIQPTKIDKNNHIQQVGHRALWVLNLWKKDNFDPDANGGHDLMEIYRAFSFFIFFKKKLRRDPAFQKYSDINNIHSIKELKEISLYIYNTFIPKDNKIKMGDMDSSDIDIIFENDKWKVIVPLTWRASRKWGRDILNTNWCTASSKSSYHYNYYMSVNDLYIFYNKIESGESLQMGFHENAEEPELKDVTNHEFDLYLFEDENPELKPLLKEILEDWTKTNIDETFREKKLIERFKRTRSLNIPYSMLKSYFDYDNDESIKYKNSAKIAYKMIDLLTDTELKSNIIIDQKYDEDSDEIETIWGNLLYVTHENPEIFEKIVKSGADVNINTVFGRSLLQWFIIKNNQEIVELLIKHGADVNIRDYYRRTPLYKAVENRDENFVELLLKYGADVNVIDYRKQTPLMECLSLYDYKLDGKILEQLLKYGADVNSQDEKGQSPLHLAVLFSDDKSAVELLLKHGANPNVKNIMGQTPLYWALRQNSEEMTNILKKYGATE